MFSRLSALVLLSLGSSVLSLPVRREVPQEHSHEQFLTSVRKSLNLNNPDGIADPVFALLGNAAAITGAGKITDATCLQQATADQAFTNAKDAGDVQGMVDALIYRALERNSGKVGATTDPCTSIQAKNPEIAAIQQHQDPASPDAAAVNKAITLELAKQIKAVGGDPQLALKSGTFAPGQLDDPTAKGNSCDDANDPIGCIFTQNLLVEDATAAEIEAAVGGSDSPGQDNATATASSAAATATSGTDGNCPAPVTVTVTAAGSTATATTAPAAATASAAAGNNLQKFTGALGGITAPTVSVGGRGFQVEGNDSFLNQSAALGRSCDVQHNKCANLANSAAGRSAGLTVGQCDQQNNSCRSGI